MFLSLVRLVKFIFVGLEIVLLGFQVLLDQYDSLT